MAAETSHYDGTIGDNGVQVRRREQTIFRNTRFVEARCDHPFAGRTACGRRKERARDVGDRFYARIIQPHLQAFLRRREQVHVRIGQAGNHRGTLEIDAMIGQRRGRAAPNPSDETVAQQDCFVNGIVVVHADDASALQQIAWCVRANELRVHDLTFVWYVPLPPR